MNGPPSLDEIRRARRRITPDIQPTPLLSLPALGTDVRVKLEAVQETGSFKLRGAANKLRRLRDSGSCRGVVTFSTGNAGPQISAE